MIYFVLPIFNEETNLGPLIKQLRNIMAGSDYKIIAVNDGSMDGSLELLKKIQKEDLIIEGTLINMNIGSVFASGIDRALSDSNSEDDILIIMESDQTNSVGLVKQLIDGIQKENHDIVIASRYKNGGSYINFPLLRKIFSYIANRLMYYYFPIKNIKDYTIFFRAYRVGIIKKADRCFGKFGLIQSKGFVANSELLIKLSLFTNRINEIPFIYDYGKKRGRSKMQILRTINEYFVAISYLKRIFEKVKLSNINM